MTCKEKLKTLYPDYESVLNKLMEEVCPESFDIANDPDYCLSCDDSCIKCWNREIPEEDAVANACRILAESAKSTAKAIVSAVQEEFGDVHMQCGNFQITKHPDGSATMVMTGDNSENLHGLRAKPPLIESDGVPQEIVDAITAPFEVPTIKDSGDRTEFATGAVRDMREGKGRCDLMPLEVVAEIVETDKRRNRDPILFDISCFLDKDDEQGTAWLKAALENFAHRAYSGCYPTMFLEVAKHFEEGAKKYGPDNWRKGIPVHCYIDSAVRHYLKWLRGDKDEPHDRAFVWNLMCCIWEVDYHKPDGDSNE